MPNSRRRQSGGSYCANWRPLGANWLSPGDGSPSAGRLSKFIHSPVMVRLEATWKGAARTAGRAALVAMEVASLEARTREAIVIELEGRVWVDGMMDWTEDGRGRVELELDWSWKRKKRKKLRERGKAQSSGTGLAG